MRRIKIRIVLVFTVLAGIVGVIINIFTGPLAPKTSTMFGELNVAALNLTASAGMNLQALSVVGRNHTNREDILDALGLERGVPILSINVTDTRESIESLPWVKSAKVERRLPGSIHIILQEFKPYALWQRGKRYTLVTRDGAEIIDVPGADQSLPLIVGPGAPQEAAKFFETVTATNAELASRIVAAVRVSDRRWNVHFDNYKGGVAVRLPEDNLAITWTHLADLERDYGILERNLSFIDLRIDGQLIVRTKKNVTEDLTTTESPDIKLTEATEQQEI
ncbi:MAG TPA: hypothetical protein DGZ24_05825 [Rhodospirillaceae bacterium]|nr:hypothetical protein [Candidatus Neomarinimicrobiota bacterium]HCX14817.1 hypothetical protein [Rhodospirillaceae bacterium]